MVSAVQRLANPQHTDSALKMSQLPALPEEHIITARRSADGSLTFDLRISHIIEQTLLRAFNRPNFRKSTIRVIDEATEATNCSNSESEHRKKNKAQLMSGRGSPPDDSDVNGSLISASSPVKRRHPGTEDNTEIAECCGSPLTAEVKTEPLSAADNVSKDQETDLPVNIKAISAIPNSWLVRGISSEEREQFERSIANASLCPYERKKNPENLKRMRIETLDN